MLWSPLWTRGIVFYWIWWLRISSVFIIIQANRGNSLGMNYPLTRISLNIKELVILPSLFKIQSKRWVYNDKTERKTEKFHLCWSHDTLCWIFSDMKVKVSQDKNYENTIWVISTVWSNTRRDNNVCGLLLKLTINGERSDTKFNV